MTTREMEEQLRQLTAYNRRLEAELAELRRWPTTPAAREGLLHGFGHVLIESADDHLNRYGPSIEAPAWPAMRGLLHRTLEEMAPRIARNPYWPGEPPDEDDHDGGGRNETA